MNRIRFTVLVIGLFFVQLQIQAQVSIGGLPESFSLPTKSSIEMPELHLRVIDTLALQQEDQRLGISNRYGVVQNVAIDLKQDANKIKVKNKGTIWQYKLQADNCYSVGVSFSTYHVPPGARLYIYNEDHTHILGAYSSLNNHDDRYLAITEFAGQHAIIEYFEPDSARFSGELQIGAISQSYRQLASIISTDIGINCPDGANWQDDKHAVARMIYSEGGSSYYCTGFLVNNVRQDGTQYFQTANHCISTSAVAKTLILLFNYEYTSCGGTQLNQPISASGATLEATSMVSDFTLLLITEAIPSQAQPYFAGWDASTKAPKSGVGIHHPAGRPKCIATENNLPTTMKSPINWEGTNTTQGYTHWAVKFDKGTTEGGSSGSPLFNENHQVIGQLHGGDEYTSYYGKQSVSWNYNTIKTGQLMAWLDPDKTGTRTLNGTYTRIKPTANFYTRTPYSCLATAISLIDKSINVPKSWQWTISPASFKFVNNTNAQSQNPQIQFTSAGKYSVKLVVKNPYGSDSLSKESYITVGDQIDVKIVGLPDNNTLCGCELDNYPISVLGASKYTFTLEKISLINYAISTDSIYLSLKAESRKVGSFDTWLHVSGTQGTCADEDSVLLHIIQPKNDDVANASYLLPGRSANYFNRCATVEESEPTDGNNSFNADTLLHNTVWFHLQSPRSGIFSIEATGFAQKLTLFKAESAEDVLSGNSEKCSQVQAATNANNPTGTARIYDLSAEKGTKYWLQVDGYAGAEGNFYIDYLCSDLLAFPNPAQDQITVLIGNQNTGQANLRIISTSGAVLLNKTVAVQTTNNRYTIDISNIAAGLYIIETDLNGVQQELKLAIVREKE